jgi:hypothetical protein
VHLAVPIKRLREWDRVKDFSQAIVEHLTQGVPPRFVAKNGPSNRVGRIFIDYLGNGMGATTVCAWSIRARPGPGREYEKKPSAKVRGFLLKGSADVCTLDVKLSSATMKVITDAKL